MQCSSQHATDTSCISGAWPNGGWKTPLGTNGGWKTPLGNTYNALYAKMDIQVQELKGAGCRSTTNNWQLYAPPKMSHHHDDGVAQKRHKYKLGTTQSALSPDKTHQNLQPLFTSRCLVVHASPRSWMATTKSRLSTCQVERCRSAPSPAEGMQASLTGTPPGHVRDAVPSLHWTTLPCQHRLAQHAQLVADCSTGTGT